MIYTIGLKKDGKKRMSLATLQAITEALDITRILDWRAEIDAASIQREQLRDLYDTKYSYVGNRCNEARITREAEDRLADMTDGSLVLLLFNEEAPGDCPRHSKLALDLGKRTPPVPVAHVYQDEIITAAELQKLLDALAADQEYEYKSKPWRPTIAELTAKDAAALAKAAGKVSKPSSVMENAICLCMQCSTLGNNRKVSNSRFEMVADADGAKADKAMLKATKMLVDSPELAAINSHIGQVKKFLNSTCLPSILPHTRSTWMVPLGLLSRTVQFLDASLCTLKTKLVPALQAAYPQRVQEARQKLGPDFNAKDYPTAERLEEEFSIDWQLVEFGVSNKIASIDAAIYKKETERMERDVQTATIACQQALRAGLADMVAHMVDRLTPGVDGKPKMFKDSMVGNFQEFLAMFDARNITNDVQLKALVDRARLITKGVDPEVLRNSDTTRAYVAKGFEQIKTVLSSMVVAKPTRKYNMEDE